MSSKLNNQVAVTPSRIKKALSEENKVVAGNFLFLFLLKGVDFLIPLLTLPYLLRVIGADGYGQIMFVLALINYFLSFAYYGFSLTGTRFVAANKHSKHRLQYIYTVVNSTRAFLCLISSLLIVILVFTIPSFRAYATLYILFIPMIWGGALLADWMYQGIERMKFIALLNTGLRLIFLVAVFAFIHDKGDLWIYPLSLSLAYIVCAIISHYLLKRILGLKFRLCRLRHITRMLKEDCPIFVNQFVPTLYNNTSGFILGLLAPISTVGIYYAIRKIADIFVTLTDLFTRAIFPNIVRNHSRFRVYSRSMLVVGFVYCLAPILLARLVFLYLNMPLEGNVVILAILMLGVLGIVFYDVYGVNYLIAKGHDKAVMSNTLIASLICFVLAYPMIQYLGILGAAINLSFARVLMGGGVFLQYRRKKSLAR